MAEATEQLCAQRSKSKSLEKNKNQSLKDHSKEVKSLTAKLEAAAEETQKLEASLREQKKAADSLEVFRKEGDKLKNALDEKERQLSDQQKDHMHELQGLQVRLPLHSAHTHTHTLSSLSLSLSLSLELGVRHGRDQRTVERSRK